MAKTTGKGSKPAAEAVKAKASAEAKPARRPAKASAKTAAKKPATEAASRARVMHPEIVEPSDRNDESPERDGDRDLAAEFREEIESVAGSDSEIDPDQDIDGDEVVRKARARGPAVIVPEIIEPSDSKAVAVADPIATYLAEIRRYPLLTREQEHDLAIRYRESGDAKAAEMLVTSNLRFVVKVAAEYSRFGAKLIDLVQEGNVGLMHAVKEFNPYKGVRLITYAVWWIRGYIQEYLMRQYSLVRIGTTQNQRKLFYRLQKEREALAGHGFEPTNALLAGRLGVTEEEVETMSKRLSGRDISLNTPIDGGNSAATLIDFEASSDQAADEAIGHLEEMEVLRRNLEKIRPSLSEKETYILVNRVLADEPMTLQEIGEHYKVTREAVRQIEARLIGKIRAAVTSSLDTHHDEGDGDDQDDAIDSD